MNYFDILLAKKLNGGSGGDVTVKSLNVTANGTYSEEGVAYSPVKVNVPTPSNAYLLNDIPSGEISTFEASALPMPTLKVSVEAKQEGSGVPSPENVRPISGWDAANVSDVDDVENPTVTQTTTISLPQTVYGGELDVVNGELRITWKSVDMGSLTWSYSPTYTRFSSTGVQDEIKSGNNQDEIMCSCYGNESNVDMNAFKTATGLIMVKDSRYTDTESFKQSVIGQQFAYMLKTPIIVPLTPSLIKSLNGQNNLSVDCGEVIEGEYFIELGGE